MVSGCPAPPATLGDYAVEVALLTDRGCQRANNEDAICHLRPDDAARLADKGLLTIVADGMGGHSGGEIASQTALNVIGQTYYASAAPPAAALAAAFHAANQAIYNAAQNNPALKGMGTTCTALALHDGAAFTAHIGDSRLYLLRGGQLVRLSEDHSVVAEMVRQGLLSNEEARRHANRHVLLRALGLAPETEFSLWDTPLPVCAGDRFILCSDGLHDLVADDEIKEIAVAHAPAEACTQLVELAKARGGPDNISLGVLSLTRPASQARARRQEVAE